MTGSVRPEPVPPHKRAPGCRENGGGRSMLPTIRRSLLPKYGHCAVVSSYFKLKYARSAMENFLNLLKFGLGEIISQPRLCIMSK